jgi:ABC-type nitrate/sulfonate/bicarbonate transport system permease component
MSVMHRSHALDRGAAATRPTARSRIVAAGWPVSVGFGVVVLGAWQSLAGAGRLPDYILGPFAIVTAIRDDADALLSGAGASMKLLVAGFAIGALLGAALGLLAGVIAWIEDLIDPLVSITYPLPKIALFPVLTVWLGFTDTARIVLIALGCFYPAFVNALSSTRGIDSNFVSVAANAGASRTRTFFSVIVPSALPRVLVGLRISLAIGFVLLFAAEALASQNGLGHLIILASQTANYSLMYAAIACFAVLGFIADRLLVAVGQRLTRGANLSVRGHG